MTKEQLTDKIESFWEWFSGMEPQFRAFFTEEMPVDKSFLVESMNNRVLDFGKFKWEMGEGKDVKYFFMISPNGNAELLDLSRQIMHFAPSLFDWEFFPAKPPKVWDFSFEIYDDFMRLLQIDASRWRCALSKNKRGLLDLILEARNLPNLDPDTLKAAGETAVINVLGEADFIKRIGSLEIIPAFEDEGAGGIFPIQNLGFEFEGLL